MEKKNGGRQGIEQRGTDILKALLCAYVVTGILLLVLTLLLYKAGLSEENVNAGIILIYVISTFSGGFVIGKLTGTRKFLWGLLLGVIYFVLLLLISLGIYHSLQADVMNLVTMFLLCALYQRAVQAVGRENVQILTPVRKNGHPCGVQNLNTVIQKMMQEAPGLGYPHYGRYFCVGDPVIQNKNADGIYNGELGVVTQVEDDHIDVLFTGYEKPIPYDDEKMNRLDLAYALTVHKSQGSEFPMVIVPVLKQHDFMLSRNLVYTAVTRGKSRVIIIGSRWELNRVITGVKKRVRDEDGNWKEVEKKDIQRKTALAARLRSSYEKLLEQEQKAAPQPEISSCPEERRLAG